MPKSGMIWNSKWRPTVPAKTGLHSLAAAVDAGVEAGLAAHVETPATLDEARDATRPQVRAMVRGGSEAVESGRPACPLCEFPMDPAGHVCPRLN